MKITIDKNVVEFTPESQDETKDLETLWRVTVDCMKTNKKIVPIGEYIPEKKNMAQFFIEGVAGGLTSRNEEEKVTEDSTYYCAVCNKYMKVKKGEGVPLCCGRDMEDMD